MEPALDKHYRRNRPADVDQEPGSGKLSFVNHQSARSFSVIRGEGEAVEVVEDDTDARVELLASVKPFHLFNERWLRAIAGLMAEEAFDAQQVIYHAGDRSDAVYLIREGEVAIYTDTVGEPVELMARFKSGDLFGEVGVLDRCRRRASAKAAAGTRVLRLEGCDLHRLGRANPNFGLKLAQRALLRHMRQSSRALELGRRRDVRIRIAQPVLMTAGDREPLPVELENLSMGGCCVRGVPDTWHLYESTPISIRDRDGAQLLSVHGRIAWRGDGSVGICFTGISRSHGLQVEHALKQLLECEQGGGDKTSVVDWIELS